MHSHIVYVHVLGKKHSFEFDLAFIKNKRIKLYILSLLLKIKQ